MAIVVDASPGKSGIGGGINAPHAPNLCTAVQRRVLVEWSGLAESDRAGRLNVPQLEERVAAIDRMPDAVHSCGASAGGPDIALGARRCLELRRRTRRR